MANQSAFDQPSVTTIGVFGGSFDPPHLAHTLLATYVLAAYPLDRLLVIPTYRHAFAKPLAPYEHRVAMSALAMADVKRVSVSRIEEEIGGNSLTLNTLEELARRNPNVRFRLVMGSDLLSETPRWHRFDRVSAIAPPLIVARAGYRDPAVEGPELPFISSSEIRERIKRDLGTQGLLSHAVAQYIKIHGLYRSKSDRSL
jgi:nicotinate-nucleotide adenylyltransferase